MGVRPPAGHLTVAPQDAGVTGSSGDLREADPPVREGDYPITIIRVPMSIGAPLTHLARTTLPPAEEHILRGVVGYGARVQASNRD